MSLCGERQDGSHGCSAMFEDKQDFGISDGADKAPVHPRSTEDSSVGEAGNAVKQEVEQGAKGESEGGWLVHSPYPLGFTPRYHPVPPPAPPSSAGRGPKHRRHSFVAKSASIPQRQGGMGASHGCANPSEVLRKNSSVDHREVKVEDPPFGSLRQDGLNMDLILEDELQLGHAVDGVGGMWDAEELGSGTGRAGSLVSWNDPVVSKGPVGRVGSKASGPRKAPRNRPSRPSPSLRRKSNLAPSLAPNADFTVAPNGAPSVAPNLAPHTALKSSGKELGAGAYHRAAVGCLPYAEKIQSLWDAEVESVPFWRSSTSGTSRRELAFMHETVGSTSRPSSALAWKGDPSFLQAMGEIGLRESGDDLEEPGVSLATSLPKRVPGSGCRLPHDGIYQNQPSAFLEAAAGLPRHMLARLAAVDSNSSWQANSDGGVDSEGVDSPAGYGREEGEDGLWLLGLSRLGLLEGRDSPAGYGDRERGEGEGYRRAVLGARSRLEDWGGEEGWEEEEEAWLEEGERGGRGICGGGEKDKEQEEDGVSAGSFLQITRSDPVLTPFLSLEHPLGMDEGFCFSRNMNGQGSLRKGKQLSDGFTEKEVKLPKSSTSFLSGKPPVPLPRAGIFPPCHSSPSLHPLKPRPRREKQDTRSGSKPSRKAPGRFGLEKRVLERRSTGDLGRSRGECSRHSAMNSVINSDMNSTVKSAVSSASIIRQAFGGSTPKAHSGSFEIGTLKHGRSSLEVGNSGMKPGGDFNAEGLKPKAGRGNRQLGRWGSEGDAVFSYSHPSSFVGHHVLIGFEEGNEMDKTWVEPQSISTYPSNALEPWASQGQGGAMPRFQRYQEPSFMQPEHRGGVPGVPGMRMGEVGTGRRLRKMASEQDCSVDIFSDYSASECNTSSASDCDEVGRTAYVESLKAFVAEVSGGGGEMGRQSISEVFPSTEGALSSSVSFTGMQSKKAFHIWKKDVGKREKRVGVVGEERPPLVLNAAQLILAKKKQQQHAARKQQQMHQLRHSARRQHQKPSLQLLQQQHQLQERQLQMPVPQPWQTQQQQHQPLVPGHEQQQQQQDADFSGLVFSDSCPNSDYCTSTASESEATFSGTAVTMGKEGRGWRSQVGAV